VTILDLCAGTGAWSKPYQDAGYRVIPVTLPNDIRFEPWLDISVQGILAAPPCTVFAASGRAWKRTEEEMLEGLSVVDACLRFVAIYNPVWWVLENPVGSLRKWLGPPKMKFNPCDYGDTYTKKTLLWGRFNQPMKINRVEPTEGSKMQLKYGGKSEKTKRERSKTPQGFAQAFFESNP
jgi:hypothetical protein